LAPYKRSSTWLLQVQYYTHLILQFYRITIHDKLWVSSILIIYKKTETRFCAWGIFLPSLLSNIDRKQLFLHILKWLWNLSHKYMVLTSETKNKLHRKRIERGEIAYLIEGQTLQHKFIHGIKFQIEYIIIIFYLHKKVNIWTSWQNKVNRKRLATCCYLEQDKSSMMI